MITDYAYRQMEILYKFIEQYQLEHYRQPSIQTMAEAMCYSPGTVDFYIRKLKLAGWLEREPGARRYTLLGIKE